MTDGERLTVYIADDDQSVRRGLTRLMRATGIESREFDSAEDLLQGLGTDAHACILLDMSLPRLHGPELRNVLRRKSMQVPVIAVSGTDDEETRNQARDLGACLFFHKPVDDQALLDAIEWVSGIRTVPPPKAT